MFLFCNKLWRANGDGVSGFLRSKKPLTPSPLALPALASSKRKNKFCSDVFCTDDINMFIMSLNDFFYNR